MIKHDSKDSVTSVKDPAGFYEGHAHILNNVGASAFGRAPEAFSSQVAERFKKASIAQVMHDDGRLVGFALYEKLQSPHGTVLSIEGRAILPEYQGRGLGSAAMTQLLAEDDEIKAAASVTRNPAVLQLMRRSFHTVSPDLTTEDPLKHIREDDAVLQISRMYSEYVGANPADTPFVIGRYEGGLYGGEDPGRSLGLLPTIASNPENGVVMVALHRRDDSGQ